MAERGEKGKKPTESKQAVQQSMDVIQSMNYGFSRQFLNDEQETILRTSKILGDFHTSNNAMNPNSKVNVRNDMKDYFLKMISMGMNYVERKETKDTLSEKQNINHLSSGAILVGDDYTRTGIGGTSIVDNGAEIMQLISSVKSHFKLIPEYYKMIELIPELKAGTTMIVQDTLNVDKLTNKWIPTDFYKDIDLTDEQNNEVMKKMNDLWEEYKIEESMERRLYKSKVCGTNPTSVLPSTDIVEILNGYLIDKIGHGAAASESLESIENHLNNYTFSEEEYFVKSPLDKARQDKELLATITNEDDKLYATQSIEAKVSKYLDNDVIDDAIAKEWIGLCMDDFAITMMNYKDNVNMENKEEKAEYDKHFHSFEAFVDQVKTSENDRSKLQLVKKHLHDIAMEMDKNIGFIEKRKLADYQTKKSIREKYYQTTDTIQSTKDFVEDFYKVNKDTKNYDPYGKKIELGGFEFDITDGLIDKEKFEAKCKTKRAIITEYDPQCVIPIAIGPIHMGYYVMDYERQLAGDGPEDSLLKDRGSLFDIIRRMGFDNDKAFMTNSGTLTSMNDSSTNPFGSPLFSPDYTNQNYGMQYSIPMADRYRDIAGSKNRVLKTILARIIAKKSGDDSLLKNGLFHSALMNLLKDEVLMKRKINFTFIPEPCMCYFGYKLDENGLPLSMYDGALMYGSAYITSIITSLVIKIMKSSNVETVEANIGQSMEAGLIMNSISKYASNKNVNAQNIFGGIDRAIRLACQQYKRNYIPIFSGERTYNLEQLEKGVDISPDDEYTGRLLDGLLMLGEIPGMFLDKYKEGETATGLILENEGYQNSIIRHQHIDGPNISKFLWNIVSMSDIEFTFGLKGEVKDVKEHYKIKKDCFNFRLRQIDGVKIQKLNESIDKANQLIETLTTTIFATTDELYNDDAEYKTIKHQFRLACLLKFISGDAWFNEIDKMVEQAKIQGVLEYAKNMIYGKPLINAEGKLHGGTDDSGSGLGGDEFGDDGMGGGFDDMGGDEFGGGDFEEPNVPPLEEPEGMQTPPEPIQTPATGENPMGGANPGDNAGGIV
jgi:hypothetical protein